MQNSQNGLTIYQLGDPVSELLQQTQTVVLAIRR
jgi:hypothetical protein